MRASSQLSLPLLLLSQTQKVTSFQIIPPHHPRQRQQQKHLTTLHVDGENAVGGNYRHIVGDVLRSLQPRYLNQVVDAVGGSVKGQVRIPKNITSLIEEHLLSSSSSSSSSSSLPLSWDELTFLLQTKRTTNPPSALIDQHLFHKDRTPRIILYRDSASWCPYCQKVWMALEERRVSYEIRRVDMNCYGGREGKSKEFLKIQPNGNLPCAIVVDGSEEMVIGTGSDDIIDVIDSMADQGSPLLRTAARNDKDQQEITDRMTYLCDDGKYDSLERRLFSEWMWWLTGVRKPLEYKRRYLQVLDEVERALAEAPDGGPFFMGREVSLADLRFVPFVERQIASLAYFKGYVIRDEEKRPCLVKWLEAMERRPSYRATKSDYYTHSRALPPQLAAECVFEDGNCEVMRDAIDYAPCSQSEDQDHALFHEPGWDWCSTTNAPLEEAATRIIQNHDRLSRFASRSAGTPGLPPVSAKFSDPRAVVNEDAVPLVDLFLRFVVSSLLERRSNNNNKSLSRYESARVVTRTLVSVIGEENGGRETVDAVVDCLDYVRARIGVPRDMSYPAAHEFRMELKALSRVLRSVKEESETPSVIEAR